MVNISGTQKISTHQTKKEICNTCANITKCFYKLNGNNLLTMYCEEFCIEGEVENQNANDSILIINKMKKIKNEENFESNFESKKEEETNSSEFKGLCMNCDNSRSCSKLKCISGVWHCEEYL
ncbi:MAG: hypothetical protein HQK51_19480 [Oligoflexia bacterium]|nr:hypothetical protein [Oligoflexia bacterium]